MHLRDLRIRAMDGSALVEGELGIHCEEPAGGRLRPPAGSLIGVNLRDRGFSRASFHVYGDVQSGSDGFYGAGPPLVTVDFEESVPDLSRLLPLGLRERQQQIRVDQFRLATVSVRYPITGEDPFRSVFGETYELKLVLKIEDDGLRIAFDGPLQSVGLRGQEPLLTRARLVGNLLVPRAYCVLQGVYASAWPSGSAAAIGDWVPSGAGLGTVAVSPSGTPFFAGCLDWQNPDRHEPSGPFVALYLRDHDLIAKPVGGLTRLASGFAVERNSWSDGPELQLFMGYAEWARLLEQNDEAEMEWRGPGLGHVDGQTGRSVFECGGPMRQPVTRLRLRLRRTGDGLRVEGDGELAPLSEAEGGTARSLGPHLRFDFLVPRAWILARGLPLPRFWNDRKREFPSEMTW